MAEDEVTEHSGRKNPDTWPDWAKPNMPENRLLNGSGHKYLRGKEKANEPFVPQGEQEIEVAVGRGEDCKPLSIFIYNSKMMADAHVPPPYEANRLDGKPMPPREPKNSADAEVSVPQNLEELKARRDFMVKEGSPHPLTDRVISELEKMEKDPTGERACQVKREQQNAPVA